MERSTNKNVILYFNYILNKESNEIAMMILESKFSTWAYFKKTYCTELINGVPEVNFKQKVLIELFLV